MNVKIIVACDIKWGIGKNNTIPWHFKEDLKFFRDITTTTKNGKKKNAVVMGYNTWLSLPKKPLSQRMNYVLTRRNADKIDKNKAIACTSLDDFFKKVESNKEVEDVFVIGGEQIYNLFIREKKELITAMYVTKIEHDYECDTFFPKISETWEVYFCPKVPQILKIKKYTSTPICELDGHFLYYWVNYLKPRGGHGSCP